MDKRRCALALLIAVALLGVSVHATMSNLEWTLETVAGQRGLSGETDGYSNESQFSNIVTMCSHDERDVEFMIGDSKLLRRFNRFTTELLTVVPSGPVWNQQIISCAIGSSGTNTTREYIVYVTALPASGMIYQMTTTSNLLTKTISTTLNMFHMVYYKGKLYILASTFILFICSTTTPNWTSEDCVTLPLGITNIPITGVTFTVQDNNIYIATGSSMIRFDLNGKNKHTLDIGAVDVKRSVAENRVYALAESNIYELSDDNTTMTKELIFSRANSTIVPAQTTPMNMIFQIFPICSSDFYIVPVASPALYILERLYLKNVTFGKVLLEPPLPVGFIDEANIMPQLRRSMNQAIGVALQYKGNIDWIKSNAVHVNQITWETNLQIEVPQQLYDPPSTNNSLSAVTFPSMEMLLAQYYGTDNITLYSDSNIIPLCSTDLMSMMKFDVASWVRSKLKYPLIYTTPIVKVNSTNKVNMTTTELLMPVPLRNDTSRGLLTQKDQLNNTLAFLQANIPQRSHYTMNFDSVYNFAALNDEQMQTARWLILSLIRKQIKLCEASANVTKQLSDERLRSGEAVTTCTMMDILITNLTQQPSRAGLLSYYDIQAFGLGEYKIPFDTCMKDLDYTPLSDWMYEILSPQKIGSRCETKCITAIAVVAAIIAACIVIIIIMIISKRRRLAVALAPETVAQTSSTPAKSSNKNSSERYKMGTAVNPYNPV